MPGFRRVKGVFRKEKKKKSDCHNTHFKQFFPSWTPPKGLRGNHENIVLICQQKSRYNFDQKAKTYYTTLFDQGLGIPVYSAYRVTSTDTEYQRRPRPTWQKNEGIPKIINYYQMRVPGSIQLPTHVPRLVLY